MNMNEYEYDENGNETDSNKDENDEEEEKDENNKGDDEEDEKTSSSLKKRDRVVRKRRLRKLRKEIRIEWNTFIGFTFPMLHRWCSSTKNIIMIK